MNALTLLLACMLLLSSCATTNQTTAGRNLCYAAAMVADVATAVLTLSPAGAIFLCDKMPEAAPDPPADPE